MSGGHRVGAAARGDQRLFGRGMALVAGRAGFAPATVVPTVVGDLRPKSPRMFRPTGVGLATRAVLSFGEVARRAGGGVAARRECLPPRLRRYSPQRSLRSLGGETPQSREWVSTVASTLGRSRAG